MTYELGVVHLTRSVLTKLPSNMLCQCASSKPMLEKHTFLEGTLGHYPCTLKSSQVDHGNLRVSNLCGEKYNPSSTLSSHFTFSIFMNDILVWFTWTGRTEK
jgi:hypothetical protein